VIEDGKIKKVGSPAQVQRDAPTGVKTIDLGNATLLPGLIAISTRRTMGGPPILSRLIVRGKPNGTA
jgi:imidazolonepropionase-like amidohydrolase